jgi:hypothetical protein
MSSTFAKIVKSQRLDRKNPGKRAFISKAVLELSHRSRTNTLRGPIKLTFWQRVQRFFRRCIR